MSLVTFWLQFPKHQMSIIVEKSSKSRWIQTRRRNLESHQQQLGSEGRVQDGSNPGQREGCRRVRIQVRGEEPGVSHPGQREDIGEGGSLHKSEGRGSPSRSVGEGSPTHVTYRTMKLVLPVCCPVINWWLYLGAAPYLALTQWIMLYIPSASLHHGIGISSLDRQTKRTKNITFPQTTYAGGKQLFLKSRRILVFSDLVQVMGWELAQWSGIIDGWVLIVRKLCCIGKILGFLSTESFLINPGCQVRTKDLCTSLQDSWREWFQVLLQSVQSNK